MLPLIAAILLCGCAAEAVFITLESRKKFLAALLFKGAASLLFVLAGGFAGQLTADVLYARLILAGLLLGAVGDICLNLRFVVTMRAKAIFLVGIAAFLLGHVAYLSALAARAPLALLYALPVAAAAAAVVIRFVLKRVEVSGAIRIFGIVYLCIVILMAACALALFALEPQNPGRALFAAGGLLFAASDVLLVLHQFGRRPYPAFRALNLSLYYLGQACIALTIALMH
ncbi:MAG: hypothetical protein GX417_03930 [Clostridiales bacterium]|nr:hypothetical protein [Clostridiales bacterium]